MRAYPGAARGAEGAARGAGAERGAADRMEEPPPLKAEPPARPPERAAKASVGAAPAMSSEATRAAATGPAILSGRGCCSGSDCLLAVTFKALEACAFGRQGCPES